MKGIFIYNDFESISFTLVVKLNLLFVSFLSLITISIEKDLVLNNIKMLYIFAQKNLIVNYIKQSIQDKYFFPKK